MASAYAYAGAALSGGRVRSLRALGVRKFGVFVVGWGLGVCYVFFLQGWGGGVGLSPLDVFVLFFRVVGWALKSYCRALFWDLGLRRVVLWFTALGV